MNRIYRKCLLTLSCLDLPLWSMHDWRRVLFFISNKYEFLFVVYIPCTWPMLTFSSISMSYTYHNLHLFRPVYGKSCFWSMFNFVPGLRTLCLAYADIPEDFYEDWKNTYYKASTSIQNRERKLEDAAELVERVRRARFLISFIGTFGPDWNFCGKSIF